MADSYLFAIMSLHIKTKYTITVTFWKKDLLFNWRNTFKWNAICLKLVEMAWPGHNWLYLIINLSHFHTEVVGLMQTSTKALEL